MEGRILANRFRVGALLGSGAMGTVYAAQDADGSPVAIKFLTEERSSDARAVERFGREASILMRIRSDNVAQVIATGHAGAALWIASKRLFGETLEERLHRVRALPAAEAASLLEQVFRGLDAAHSVGVVHRDVKPSNVFLERLEGATPVRARLLDFGISKIRPLPDTSTSDSSLTSALEPLGTFVYMPPEQFGDAANVDERADLYATAVVIFRVLSGALPFSGRSQTVILQQKLCDPPRSLAEVTGVRWPRRAETFIRRAVAVDPAHRFASARAMLDAWRHVVASPSLPHPRHFDAAVIAQHENDATASGTAFHESTVGAAPRW